MKFLKYLLEKLEDSFFIIWGAYVGAIFGLATIKPINKTIVIILCLGGLVFVSALAYGLHLLNNRHKK